MNTYRTSATFDRRRLPGTAAAPPTMLSGRRLMLARGIWAIVAGLIVTLIVLSIPARFAVLRTICTAPACPIVPQLSPAGYRTLIGLGLSPSLFAAYVTAVNVVIALVFFAAGAGIFWRKSSDWMTIYASLTLIIIGATGLTFLDALIVARPAWHLALTTVRAFGLWMFILLWYLFPTGRFVPGWTRVLAVGALAWALLSPFTPLRYPSTGWSALFVGWVATSAFAQIYRYRYMASPVERQQTKWIVLGGAAAFVGLAVGLLLPPLVFPAAIRGLDAPVSNAAELFYQAVWIPVVAFGGLLLIPVSITLSLLRYRLWDVDPIINRTLVYSTLTVALVALYFACIALLQQFFRRFTGQQSDLAIVASTLAIAALFQPLRRRIQVAIDRRFYRHKYDAQHTLAAFAERLRGAPDLQTLTGDLLVVVDESLRPSSVSLWLRTMDGRTDGDEPG